MWSNYLNQKYGKDDETDLVKLTCQNGNVNDDEDDGPDAESQAHVVQCPGHPAAPLRRILVPGMVGFTG